MKTPLLIIFFLFLKAYSLFSQETEVVPCGNDSIVRLSGFDTDINLSACSKNVEVSTIKEDIVIKNTLLVKFDKSIRFTPKDDYSIRILPGDFTSNDSINARGPIRRRTVAGAAAKEEKKPSSSVVEIKEAIVLYPNPAEEYITINTIENINAYRIYNSQSLVLLQGRIPDNNTIWVNTLPTGLYYIHLEINNEIIPKTFYKN